MIRKHLTKISFILSILLHLLLLLLYTPLGRIHFFPLKAENLINEPQVDEKRITFELVETPEDARSEESPKDTDLVSDKNSIARDQSQNEDKPTGNPYSEGDLDVKNVISSFREIPVAASKIPDMGTERENEPSQIEKGRDAEPTGTEQSSPEKKQPLAAILPSQNLLQGENTHEGPLYNNEMSNSDEYGGLTFNTYDWDFAPYLLEMKRKIEKNMYPPPAFTRFGLISGETVVRFRVMPDGEVKEHEVLYHIGHETLQTTSLQAILLSSAFSPLPRDFPEEFLEVTCSFKYIVKRSHK